MYMFGTAKELVAAIEALLATADMWIKLKEGAVKPKAKDFIIKQPLLRVAVEAALSLVQQQLQEWKQEQEEEAGGEGGGGRGGSRRGRQGNIVKFVLTIIMSKYMY
jgi:hypothetical protein